MTLVDPSAPTSRDPTRTAPAADRVQMPPPAEAPTTRLGPSTRRRAAETLVYPASRAAPVVCSVGSACPGEVTGSR